MKQSAEAAADDIPWRAMAQLGDLIRIVANKNSDSGRMSRITVNQARIFGYVFDRAEDGVIRLKRLAHDLDVSPAAASQAVDRLVRAGLVSRVADPTDRRAVSISFSAKGRRLYEKFDRRARAVLEEAFDGVSAADRAAFFRVISGIHSRLSGKWMAILAERDAAK